MLPLLIRINSNFVCEGIMSCAPMYQSTLLVCDGEVLMGKALPEAAWDMLMCRKKLVNETQKLTSHLCKALEAPEEMQVRAIVNPDDHEHPNRWRAMLVYLNDASIREVRQSESVLKVLLEEVARPAATAARDFLGEDLGIVSGVPEFENAVDYILTGMEGAEGPHGQLILPPMVMSGAMEEALAILSPAMQGSHLDMTTPSAPATKRRPML